MQSSLEVFRDCWFLSGPTASGKTAVAIALARQLGAEIISMDSMAVYRGMDIGTAKPTAAQRAATTHYLIDLVEASEEFSVVQYLDAAAEIVRQIHARGRTALFVGGTPLYLKSLLRGFSMGPEANRELRAALLDRARECGPGQLHRQLAKVDSATAARLHPNDVRRVVRALEVYEQAGRPMSEFQQQGTPISGRKWAFVLVWPRERLNERIDRRVEEMFQAGLVEEVRVLTARGSLSRTALQAVGYREALAHLSGELSLSDAMALVKTRTRQFAKRQMTWFRSLRECQLVEITEAAEPEAIADRIIALASAR